MLYQDVENRGEWVLVLVDTEKATIPFGVRTKTSEVGNLLSKLGNAAHFAGGRQPTPPQLVHEWNQAAALIEWARLAAPDLAGAELGGICKTQ
ncbi:MAG: hypothetical protein H7138_08505 [Myxococcales bacterium]|nr:hypothetical protein [Myxococcales bacterium]